MKAFYSAVNLLIPLGLLVLSLAFVYQLASL